MKLTLSVDYIFIARGASPSQDAARQTLPRRSAPLRCPPRGIRERYTRGGIQLADNEWRWCGFPSPRRNRTILSRARISRYPELNGDRVRSRVCEHRDPTVGHRPFVYPSNPIIITRRTAIQSGSGRAKRIHCHASCRPPSLAALDLRNFVCTP